MAITERICSKCKEMKPVEEFRKSKRVADGYNRHCNACQLSYVEKWQSQHVPLESKRCSTCKEVKTIDLFNRDRNTKNGYTSRCKQCLIANAKSKEYFLDMHRRRTYGITSADYDRMERNQNGKCAICRAKGNLHIDHCHTTGKVRGLLCCRCNLAIGSFRDDPHIVRQAAIYLEHHLSPESSVSSPERNPRSHIHAEPPSCPPERSQPTGRGIAGSPYRRCLRTTLMPPCNGR